MTILTTTSELDEKGQINREKAKLRKKLTFDEYVERMNKLSLNERMKIIHQKKDYCDYIPEILKKNGLPVIHNPGKTKKFKGLHSK